MEVEAYGPVLLHNIIMMYYAISNSSPQVSLLMSKQSLRVARACYMHSGTGGSK